ncbi:sel1 repeat family protein [Alkalihalobacterium alkalinitrilicum]|uniref:sel1 repeat family protein n=1 Tax=Alkalihalobacterium alkalinitrilicum TaxID=427920 RepID=UPI000994AB7D|nr:sel1 repeat family protein [Alkalihalobacterium alkalinitrilicum]
MRGIDFEEDYRKNTFFMTFKDPIHCYYDDRNDVDPAMKWYEKAAVNQHLQAIFNYGLACIQKGDYEEGTNWYEKAAQLGYARTPLLNEVSLYLALHVEKENRWNKELLKRLVSFFRTEEGYIPHNAIGIQNVGSFDRINELNSLIGKK